MGIARIPQIANLFGTLFTSLSDQAGGSGVFDASLLRNVSSLKETADIGFQFIAESAGKARQTKGAVKAKSAPLAKPASVRKKPTLLASLADEGGIARPSLLGQ